jgi:hypothetical protein
MRLRPALLFIVWTCAAVVPSAAAVPDQVTFSKDVAPILQKRCQSCHRPGEVAPMSLVTYAESRPWARAIREKVVTRRMPPWPADPRHGSFRNDPSLTQDEIDVLVKWVDTGGAEGDRRDLPPPLLFEDGWHIGRPDVVYGMPTAFQVPAQGTIDIVYVVLRTDFKEDRWIQAAELQPGNRAVVHHANAYIRPRDPQNERRYGKPFVSKYTAPPVDEGQPASASQSSQWASDALVGFVPGYQWKAWEPGQAKRLPAGADIWLQVHYSANGTPGEDRTRLALVLAKEPPRERIVSAVAKNWTFRIPAGAPNHPVQASVELAEPVKLISLHPHMHYRGKDYEYRAIYPDGRTEVLLRIPQWDFDWQLTYFLDRPKLLPRGTRIEAIAHYDNTAANRRNPNPNVVVTYGEQSWDEMMSGWMEVAFDPKTDPDALFVDPTSASKP